MVGMAIDPNKLQAHIADYNRLTRRNTDRFVCPITEHHCDPSELMNGHILNESIRFASKGTVIQWKKVDNFYGTRVEASLVEFLNIAEKTAVELLSDQCRVNVEFPDGSQMPAFRAGIAAAERYPGITLSADGDFVNQFFAKTEKDDPRLVPGRMAVTWSIPYNLPHHTAALLKSAFLTLFNMMGYKYVFSPHGRFVQTSLANYFENDASREDAAKYFSPYLNSIHTLWNDDNAPANTIYPDTLKDSMVAFHFTPDDDLFALSLIFVANGRRLTIAIPWSAKSDQRDFDRSLQLYRKRITAQPPIDHYIRWAQYTHPVWHMQTTRNRISHRSER
jgi:hypothetical protein